MPIATLDTLVVHLILNYESCMVKVNYIYVTIINKMNTTNGNISKEGEHHYAQVQLPGGIVVKGTSTNTLPRKMAQMDASQKVLAKLQVFWYKTKH